MNDRCFGERLCGRSFYLDALNELGKQPIAFELFGSTDLLNLGHGVSSVVADLVEKLLST